MTVQEAITQGMPEGYWYGTEAEKAPPDHSVAIEGGPHVDLHQHQKLCYEERPLKRKEGRVCNLKSCGIHLSEKALQNKEAGKVDLPCPCLLKHQAAQSEGEPPRSTESGEALHTGKRHYKCGECGKDFSQKYLLVQHERLHTGEKPYECSECGKLFSLNADLIQHQRVHTGEKPFTCSECGKAFRHNSTLVQQHRIHTGIRPYECANVGNSLASTPAL